MNNKLPKPPVDLMDLLHHQAWEEELEEVEEEEVRFQDSRPWKVEVESDDFNNVDYKYLNFLKN